jgi:hypothetical protein
VPNLYRILGVRSGADTHQIKAAYRKLAKRFHPDVNAGNSGAEQRLKEINGAYQTLGSPKARAAYDLELSRARAEARARLRKSAATATAAFLLTAGSILVAALPILKPTSRHAQTEHEVAQVATRDGEPARIDVAVMQPAQPLVSHEEIEAELPREPARTVPVEDLTLSAAGQAGRSSNEPEDLASAGAGGEPRRPSPLMTEPEQPRSKPANWTSYRNTRFGFALRYPADIFTSTGATGIDGNERLLRSRDGRALLWISATPNRTGGTAAEYRRALMAGRYAGAAFDYAPERSNWFVLSGTIGAEMFYERITFSCDRRTLHRWLVLYPVAERAFFDGIVDAIHRSYRYDLTAGRSCAAPVSRRADRMAPTQDH